MALFANGRIKSNSAMIKSLKITGIYFIFGCIWIVATDLLSGNLFKNFVAASIAKGLFYVAVTAALIFLLIYPALKKVMITRESLQNANSRLDQSETLFRAVFDQATIGIAIGNNGKYIAAETGDRPSVNPMFEKITGRSKEELAGVSWLDITHPDDLAADLADFEKFKAGVINGYDMEKRYIRPDGSEAWIHMTISPLFMDNSSEFNHLCIIEDIGKRKEIEKVLLDSERSKAVLLDNLPGMAYRCRYDRDWTMQFVSEGCLELTGYKPESLLNNNEKSFNDLILPKYQEYLWNKWKHVLKERSRLSEEYEIVTASGEVKWVFEQGQGVFDEDGNVIALEGLIIDITKRKEQEIRLKYINNHDLLTGIYNRRYFQEVVSGDIDKKSPGKRAVILVNLRRFNLINSTFGYAFGENVIKELAGNLSRLCSDDCQLFHISNDRFVYYLRNYESRNELTAMCETIVAMLDSAFASMTAGGNIGVVEIADGSCDAESILKNASIASESVNEHKTFAYGYFNNEMEEKVKREVEIKNDLAKAAFGDDMGGLYLVYQPVIDLKTDIICGFEALACFNSEKLGILSPAEFIPIAEKTQLIVPLGKKIMHQAFRFLKKLEAEGYDDVSVSFNVSAIQLLRDDFLSDLTEIIKETGASPCKLCAEITESIFTNNYQDMNIKLEKVKELGFKIAIDDFGTGYSSLARERELNVNCLKIDKYFINKLIDIDAEQAITGDIISMAHKLGHSVVAEGVEHEKQKRYLIEHNCDFMQGYLYSKPISDVSAVEILKKTGF